MTYTDRKKLKIVIFKGNRVQERSKTTERKKRNFLDPLLPP